MKNYFYFSLLSLFLVSCSAEVKKNDPITIPIDESITESPSYSEVGKLRLSEYGLFEEPIKALIPSENVFLYELNSPLFTDYAKKERFIYLPEDSLINYKEIEVLDFPIGSILIKNFYYSAKQIKGESRKIIETRLLIHKSTGWLALPYIWNKEQSDAFLEITGGTLALNITNNGADYSFDYGVPTMNQCKSCHEKDGKITPIGPSVRQLNRNKQIENLVNNGHLRNAPAQKKWPKLAEWDNPKLPLNDRARAYLDINCAHCHFEGGPAKNSGLALRYDVKDPYELGFFKKPIAAGKGSGGFTFDILPGNADESILLYRMNINDPGTRMPELGRNLIHKEGVALIRGWIEGMDE